MVPAAAELSGLRIERDGRELGRGSWWTAMPVDGGEHVVRATAPNRQSFTTTIVIGNEADVQSVEIPVLAAAPVAVAAPSVASSSPALVEAPRSAGTDGGAHRVRRTAGWVVGGAGLVQLGLAGYFGWRAYEKKCPDVDSMCSTSGDALRFRGYLDGPHDHGSRHRGARGLSAADLARRLRLPSALDADSRCLTSRPHGRRPVLTGAPASRAATTVS